MRSTISRKDESSIYIFDVIQCHTESQILQNLLQAAQCMIEIRKSNTKASPIIKEMNTIPTEYKPAEHFKYQAPIHDYLIKSGKHHWKNKRSHGGCDWTRVCESRVDRQWWVVLDKGVCTIAAKFPNSNTTRKERKSNHCQSAIELGL